MMQIILFNVLNDAAQRGLSDSENNYVNSCRRILQELNTEYSKAIVQHSGRRIIRKLTRKCRLLEAYIDIQEHAHKVLKPYYSSTSHIVNRFWALQDFVSMFRFEHYPSTQDFFLWFTNSETIALEREEDW
jgi:hypothetical protein